MKTMAEVGMILFCFIFWSVVLPVAGLMEVGVLIADRLEGRVSHGLHASAIH